MAGGASVDVRQLRALNKRLERLASADMDRFCRDCAKELAARLLRKVIKRTPVGVYNKPVSFTTKTGRTVSFTPKSGKTGGTLLRGWTAPSHAAAESGTGLGQSAAEYAGAARVVRSGSLYCITVSNPVKYAPYVEYGHRSRSHKSWVPGRFMLTMSVQEVQGQAQGILDRKLTKFLGGVFDGSR